MVTVNNSTKQRNRAQRALDRKQNIERREKNGTVSKIKKKKKKRSKYKQQKDINRLKNYNKYMQSKLMVNKLTKQYEGTFINGMYFNFVFQDKCSFFYFAPILTLIIL